MYDMSFHHRSLSRSGYAGNFNSPTHDLPPLITKLLKNSRFTDTRWNPANNLAQKGFCVKAESELSTLLSLSAERSLFPSKFLNISSRALHKVVVSKTAYDRRFYYYSFRGSRVILDKTSLMRGRRDVTLNNFSPKVLTGLLNMGARFEVMRERIERVMAR